MTRGHTIRLVVLTPALAILLSCGAGASGVAVKGVSSGSPAANTTASSSAPAAAQDRLSAPVTLGDGKLQAVPPSPADQPSVSSQAAYDAYRKLGLPDYEAEGGGEHADVKLARVTDRDAGEIQLDGSVKQTIQDRLVWLMRFSNLPCRGSGGGAGGDPKTTIAQSLSTGCEFALLIDAGTGQALESVEYHP